MILALQRLIRRLYDLPIELLSRPLINTFSKELLILRSQTLGEMSSSSNNPGTEIIRSYFRTVFLLNYWNRIKISDKEGQSSRRQITSGKYSFAIDTKTCFEIWCFSIQGHYYNFIAQRYQRAFKSFFLFNKNSTSLLQNIFKWKQLSEVTDSTNLLVLTEQWFSLLKGRSKSFTGISASST